MVRPTPSFEAWLLESFGAGAIYYLGRVFQAGADGEWRYLPGEPDPKLRLVGRPYLERRDADGDARRSVPSLVLRSLVRKRVPGSLLKAYQTYAADRRQAGTWRVA